jgi:Putative Zn-dependent protease, contains TPR repeats
MFEFIKRLFRGEEAPEPGSLVEELWLGDMTGEKSGRFLEVEEPGYAARYAPAVSEAEARLELRLDRPNLFAWTEAPLYRHSDFVLEGSFSIADDSGDSAPYSACGFLFRYQDENNFYTAIVSNRGFFRLDVVFNGNPRALVAWTELPPRPAGAGTGAGRGYAFSLRVIARGDHISLMVDDEWVAEVVDESFDRGHIAFAAQDYEGSDPARFELRSCMVESRPVEVETWFYRYNAYLAPLPLARRRLAETFFSMGESLQAAVQLRKLEKQKALDPDELFLKAEACLRMGMREEATEALDACIAAAPERNDAAEEKANLLYLNADYLGLRDALARLLPTRQDSARLWCLSGHAKFNLGDFPGAGDDYHRAAELDPGQALFRMDEARAWDQAEEKSKAADAYLAAARLFSAQEADDDLALALARLAALRPRSAEAKEIRAKAFYRAGKKAEAEKLLAELVAKGSEDSAVHYTLGLIYAEKGEGEKALERFESALKLEPEFALYAFRYAERLFLLGRDAEAAIGRALELAAAPLCAPDTAAWIRNLAGQAALGRGELEAARPYLEAAAAALPGESAVAINLAELESRAGKTESAIAALAAFKDDAAARNQAGNVYAAAAGSIEATEQEKRDDYLEAAVREYQAAARLDPDSSEYQTNLAAAYIELERYSDAEEALRKALDSGGGSRALLLAGNLAMIFGELPRAEASYRLGLEADPSDPSLVAALGRCYLGLRKKAKASALAVRLDEIAEGNLLQRDAAVATAAKLRAEIEEATTEPLSCSGCGRIWRVPRELPAQSASNIRAMPPDDSPAGACPNCGKVYCIACRKGALSEESRFTCPDCGEALKLSDNRLRYLVRESLKRMQG